MIAARFLLKDDGGKFALTGRPFAIRLLYYMWNKTFYDDGLKFSCQRCSMCCRAGPGFVFLSREDAETISRSLNMPLNEFIQVYCRWVHWEDGQRLSLKEKTSLDCIFWDEGCSIYEARPVQCRTYPFWEAMLASEEAWRRIGFDCPGAGNGSLVCKDFIELCMNLDSANPIMMKTDFTGN
ncbi:MAG: YkgJ family cysteine cluster protein [Spirochaetaceae bacterium]|nr:YkgJ family cysteine cluster protein [Spirochaetaceae bacterium]